MVLHEGSPHSNTQTQLYTHTCTYTHTNTHILTHLHMWCFMRAPHTSKHKACQRPTHCGNIRVSTTAGPPSGQTRMPPNSAKQSTLTVGTSAQALIAAPLSGQTRMLPNSAKLNSPRLLQEHPSEQDSCPSIRADMHASQLC